MYRKKLLSIATIALLALSIMTVLAPTVKANTYPNWVKVDPPYYKGDHVSETFDISVKVNCTEGEGGHGMFGYAFKFYWDSALINATGCDVYRPADWGSNWADVGGGLIWDFNATHGRYDTATTALSPAEEVYGVFTLVTVHFHVIYEPYYPEPNMSCVLNLVDVAVSGKAGFEIHVDVYDGLYEIERKMYPPPTIYVDPPSTTGALGTPVTVDINIKELVNATDMCGWEIHLHYNTTLLDTLDVTEGDFLSGFAGASGTFFVPKFGDVYRPPYVNETFESMGEVSAACVLLGPHTAPYGDGTLCTITFNVTYESLTYPPPSCVLKLFPTYLSDCQAKPIDHKTEDGYFTSPFKPLGLVIDAYICGRDDLYSGKGPNVPADMFQPQATVCVCAEVKYNGWPVQSKNVVFEIRGAHGELVSVGTALTNDVGIAMWCFGLPWPCEDPEEEIFGTWNVITTVDVRKMIANDTLPFKVGWIIDVIDVWTEEPAYSPCEMMNITFKYTTEAMMMYNVVFTVVVYDDLGVPIGFVMFDTEWGGVTTWCNNETATFSTEIHVPKWAFLGEGTIYVSALTALPSEGGHAYCPTRTAKVGLILP
ncbi:MAG: cohesin domain-containing protein [Thermoproteota archaeon]|nr:cohesin domain-containing protein [Thermoproteota archaeon]